MTTISRLNTTISDHNMLTNFIAVCLLVSGCLVGVIAASQSGNLAQQSFGTPQAATSNIQTAEQASTLTLSVGNAAPRSLQNQPKDVADQLQPAQNMLQSSTAAASTLQPATNSVQLTGGADLQNAASVLQ